MNISVILCTYNRCQRLTTALESLEASVLPATREWEILIVDNNSKDQTRQVAEIFSRRQPDRFRYIFEPTQGKSYALNTGIRESRGSILAFVDDDVTVEPSWLQNLTAELDSAEWAGAGGRIFPAPGFTPPRWLPLEGPWRQGAALFAHFDLGETPGELKEPPYGTNMAFRKEMFHKYGDFRTDLGPRPGREIRNEDTELGTRMLNGGEKLRYVPSAVVYHPVPLERVRKSFFRDRYLTLGRAEVREKGPHIKIAGIPRYCYRTSRAIAREVLKSIRTSDPKEKFGRRCVAWFTVGMMFEVCWQSIVGQRNDPVAKSRTVEPVNGKV
jgi:glucosyl-dolichyl phosphate glucuronosyltransferase